MIILVMHMEKPNRKQNRLAEFDYGQEGSYFVTLCTQNRARLFDMEMPVGNGLCAVPDNDLCVVPDNDLYVVPGNENGTAHRPCPTKGNLIVHKWIRETENKYPDVTIDKYVVMPDHLHLIVTIKERHAGCSLPDVMCFFKTMTTNEYIRGVKDGILLPFDGKLWQKSYYDHVIRNQQDYNEIWEYIENNPAKWIIMHEKP